MPSLREFSRRMTVRATRFVGSVDQMVRRAALAADQAVVMATPVDTGRARSNWIVSLGAPATEEIEPYVPGELGETGSANTQAALDQGMAVIERYRGQGSIHITNNVSYIVPLNEGSSPQAPKSFVQIGVREAIQAIAGEKVTD